METQGRPARHGWAWLDAVIWIVAILLLLPLLYHWAEIAIQFAASIEW